MNIQSYKLCDINEIFIERPEHTLYIIGNGFDLMHGVSSSYYNFRDFLGKASELRKQLEEWNLEEDLWADFENNLAHMDDRRMLELVPDMMKIMGVLREDDDKFSAADFFATAEMCVYPLQIIQKELPKSFRKWINSLKFASKEKPLVSLLHKNSMYINFNYTEFLEVIYGIEKENILYIHGDRREEAQELILGHEFEIEEDSTFCDEKIVEFPFFDQTSYDICETSIRYVGDYYGATSKQSLKIIYKHKSFFDNLKKLKDIVVIGHSLSKVDYLYFQEIIRMTNRVTWNIGWHSFEDLGRIKLFVESMRIDKKRVRLFRT